MTIEIKHSEAVLLHRALTVLTDTFCRERTKCPGCERHFAEFFRRSVRSKQQRAHADDCFVAEAESLVLRYLREARDKNPCPSCGDVKSRSSRLDDDLITTTRCSPCGHEWTAKLDEL